MKDWDSARTTEGVVGLYLTVLGIGLVIPRSGTGLYSIIHSGGDWQLWFVITLGGGAALIAAAWVNITGARVSSVTAAMLVWLALQAKFLEASLWGASMQAFVSISLLFACLLNITRAIKIVPASNVRKFPKGKT